MQAVANFNSWLVIVVFQMKQAGLSDKLTAFFFIDQTKAKFMLGKMGDVFRQFGECTFWGAEGAVADELHDIFIRA